MPHSLHRADTSNDGLWRLSLDTGPPLRDPIQSNFFADVVIVGGGFTGLWAAYHLKRLQPDLSIVIVEAERLGAGASGRNAGWLMGSLEGLSQLLQDANDSTRQIVVAKLRQLIPDVRAILALEGIDCQLAQGGSVMAASPRARQNTRAQQFLDSLYRCGFSEDDYRWLSAEALSQQVNVPSTGGIFTPHVAAIQPLQLLHGLARTLERQGVQIFEQSRVDHIGQRQVQVGANTLRCEWVIQATEGLTAGLAPMRRALLPVRSSMVSTEPLTDDIWAEIGFGKRQTFCDFSSQPNYFQRTSDHRLVIGARAEYPWRGRFSSQAGYEAILFAQRARLCERFFPQLKGVHYSHGWSGVLGVPRRFAPHVVVDRDQGFATAGGYLGEGVGGSFLLSRDLAGMVTGLDPNAATMPWVHQGSVASILRRWEPEPLPWLGFKALQLKNQLLP